MILLRPYQDAWVRALGAAFSQHSRVLGVLPTGGGKTVCFCRIAQGAAAKGNRVTLLAHRIEIVEQIGLALARERVPHGFVAPGRRETDELVQVAMVQTLATRLPRLRQPKLLVVDEAHHATAGSYRKIADAWSEAFVLGVTASPARTDGRGLGECFDTMVTGVSMRELLARGYLSSFTYLAPRQLVDLGGIKTRAGDYAQDQLAAAMDRAAVTGDAVKHYAQHLGGRPAIAFCVSVAHAEHVAAAFRGAGIRAESVDGAMRPDVRRQRIEAIGNGALQVLTSCEVVSEGVDVPVVAGALLLRPTQSLIVYLQQVGRVLRPKPDGSAAVILDHVGNVFRHGLPDAERAWSLEGRMARQTASPVRQCPRCYAAFAPAPKCPQCGHVIPVRARPAAAFSARPGTLAEVSATDVAALRLRRLREAPLKELLREARTIEQLREIGEARRYGPKWAGFMLNFKQQARRRHIAYGAGRAA